MSVVPSNVKPVNSTELKSFSLPAIQLPDKEYRFDAVQLHNSYVRNCIIKNFSNSELIYWRNNIHSLFDIVSPLSEIEIKGWFSFLDVRKDPDVENDIDGIVSFELVKILDAVQ